MVPPLRPVLALTASLTLTLTACTSGGTQTSPGFGDSAARTTAGSTAGTTGGAKIDPESSPDAAPALTPDAYQAELAAVSGRIGKALRDIAKARTLKSLGQRVERARKTVAAAVARLEPLRPPAEIGAEHTDYVTALRALRGRLDGLGDAVADRSLCAASSVLARLGKSKEFAMVKRAGAGFADEGGSGYRVAVIKFTPPKERNRRLGNGTILASGIRGGRGGLTVQNGTGDDSVVTLLLGKRKAVSVYVRKGSTVTVSNIRDGTYRVYFTSGVDYDRAARTFTRRCVFQRFDDPLPYRTVYTATQVRWSNWTLTLNKVVGGNASTSHVSPDDFPA